MPHLHPEVDQHEVHVCSHFLFAKDRQHISTQSTSSPPDGANVRDGSHMTSYFFPGFQTPSPPLRYTRWRTQEALAPSSISLVNPKDFIKSLL